MDLTLFGLLTDLALLILIWMVQLVVYPGFKYFTLASFKLWHPIYTGRIGFIVGPLMLTQILLAYYFLIDDFEFFKITTCLLVTANWILTFGFFMPWHRQLQRKQDIADIIQRIIHFNWIRTFLWTIVFLINLFQYGK